MSPPATLVVNIKDTSHFDVYCGRASACPEWFKGDGKSGLYGNPFWPGMGIAMLPDGTTMAVTNRLEAIDAYKVQFTWWIEHDADFRRRILGLKGRTLGCWCIPLPCHVSLVIVPWLEKQP